MNSITTINVTEVLNQSRLRPFHGLVLTLCCLCMVMDGFDVQAIGYVAPAIIKDWHITKASLGPVFGGGLFGMLIGSLCLGPLADKLGRRPVLTVAMLFVGACTALTAHATSIRELLILRLLTGVGMGAIIPNAIALAGEYSPTKFRVTLMMVISSGFIIGGALGGAIAAALIPTYGWSFVFIVGGIAPAVIGVAMLAGLPESLQFLVLRGNRQDKAKAWLRRIDPSLQLDATTELLVPESGKNGLPVIELFRQGRALGTLLLWLINFMNLLCSYFLSAWIPVLMNAAGYPTSQAVLAGTTLWTGGLLGNWFLGWVVDRRGFGAVLVPTFFVAAIAIAGIGQSYGAPALAFFTIAVTGFCVLGGQSALNALGASYYHTAMRATGMGWALAVGRSGAVIGPVVGAELMRLNWSTGNLFLAAAVPAAITMLGMLAFSRFVTLPKPAAAQIMTTEAESTAAQGVLTQPHDYH